MRKHVAFYLELTTLLISFLYWEDHKNQFGVLDISETAEAHPIAYPSTAVKIKLGEWMDKAVLAKCNHGKEDALKIKLEDLPGLFNLKQVNCQLRSKRVVAKAAFLLKKAAAEEKEAKEAAAVAQWTV